MPEATYTITSAQHRLKDLTDEIQIDKHSLDNELVKQPGFYNEVAREAVKALAQRDNLKHELDLVKAQLDSKLRAKHAGDKITEAFLSNQIIMQNDFQDAQIEHSQWAHLANAFDALKDAVSQRSYVLKDLVALHIAGYYAQSSASGPRASAIDRRSDAVLEARREGRHRL